MVTIPGFLALFVSLPAAAVTRVTGSPEARRRRAIQSLDLSRHILRDVGLEGYVSPADDPRWTPRPDLDR